MKKMLIVAMAVVSLWACKSEQKKGGETSPLAQEETVENNAYVLLGKTLRLKYDTGLIAEVSYISEDKIHWETFEEGKQTGESDELATYLPLNDGQFFCSWIEEDGTTVSQVIDLKKMKITAILTVAEKEAKSGRATMFLQGDIEEL